MVKNAPVELKCKCGHDIMMHGHHNMGCSTLLPGDGKEHKCPCAKFEHQ